MDRFEEINKADDDSFYVQCVKLDDDVQILYMVYLIRTYEDIELDDKFVISLWNVYLDANKVENINDFVTELAEYSRRKCCHIFQICVEDFRDYLYNEN